MYPHSPGRTQSGVKVNSGFGVSSSNFIDYSDSELCALHKGELIIARDKNENKYGCNKCIFERQLKQPIFLAFAAKQTKKKVDERYEILLRHLKDLENLDPVTFQNKVQSQVNDFFQKVYKQIREVEKEVISQIKSSVNLQSLREALEALHAKINHKEFDQIEDEKKAIDGRVDT